MWTSDEWAAYLERLLPLLTTGNSLRARQAAANFAQQFYDQTFIDTSDLVRLSKSFSTIGPRQLGSGMVAAQAPDKRDPQFDADMAAFIDAARTTIDELRAFEAAVAANDGHSRQEYRGRVLRYLATKREHVWAREIVCALRIAPEHVQDSLEQLADEYLFTNDSQKLESLGGETWYVRLNSDGRRLVDGTPPARPAPSPSVAINTNIDRSTFTSSPVTIAAGDVSAIFALPPMPEALRRSIEADAAAAPQLLALEQELAKPQPRPNVVHRLFKTFRFAVESGNVATELATHWQAWVGTATTALAHFLS